MQAAVAAQRPRRHAQLRRTRRRRRPPPPAAAGTKTVTIIDGSSGKRQEVVDPRRREDNARAASSSACSKRRATAPIPNIAPDGARPAEVYARAVQAAAGKPDGPRIAIVVGGLGISASAHRRRR